MNKAKKIVIADYYYPHIEQEKQILSKLGNVEIIDVKQLGKPTPLNEHELIDIVHDADAIITQFTPITRSVIQELSRCRIISRYAIGVDVIDVQAATENNIAVANVPDYCIEEVSDEAVGHMLNCLRKISYASGMLKNGTYTYEKVQPMRRISGLTVGLVAFGNIARRTAEKLRPFGCKIIAYDPFYTPDDAYSWVTMVSLEDLLAQSDVLSLHAPLSEKTRGLISENEFRGMKDGVVLVNTARGGLIDEKSLFDALDSGKVSICGLDVLDCHDSAYGESPISFHERAVVTPHMGWYSEDSRNDLQQKAALNVYEMLTSGKPRYCVNREVL